MRTTELAKIIDLIAHPIRIEILKTLLNSSQSYSQLLKSLSLNSTSKFSFHLDKLHPLVEKDHSGKYFLTDAGFNLIKLIDSHEEQSEIPNVSVTNDLNRTISKEESKGFWLSFIGHPNFFFIYFALSISSFLCSLFFYYFYNFIVGLNDWNAIFDFFLLFLLLVPLVFPFGFFILYFIHLDEKFFPTFFLGLVSYILIFSTTLFFILACHGLVLDIMPLFCWNPEYFPINPLDAIINFIGSIMFNNFHESMFFENVYLVFQLFWLIVYVTFAFGLFFISKRFNLIKWKVSELKETKIFPQKLGVLESSSFWSIVIVLGIVVTPVFSALYFDINIFGLRFFSQLLPIAPVLLLTLIILLFEYQKFPLPRYLLLLVTIFLGPLFLCINVYTDSFPLLQGALLGIYQVLAQFCFVVIFLKLIRYWKLMSVDH